MTTSVKQREYLNVLLTKRCDGLILSALADSDGELLRKMKVPAVLLDRAPSDLAIDAVAVDNRAGGALAARHLLGLGRRRPPASPAPRSAHFQRAHRRRARRHGGRAGVALADRLCWHADFTSAGGHAAALTSLALPPGQRPDALFCCNDLMAFGALRAAAERALPCRQSWPSWASTISTASFVHPALAAWRRIRANWAISRSLPAESASPTPPCRASSAASPAPHVRGSSVAATVPSAVPTFSPATELMGMTS